MESNRNQLGYRAGIVSIITNAGLFILKYWAGIVSGSVALIADAWHTLSDSLSSLIVIIGVKLSSRKPDREHPFGHGRWEELASIFIAFLLVLIAYDFLKESITKFRSGEEAEFGTFAIVVTVISVLSKEALARYSYAIAKRTGNSSLRADGWHHRSDALSSLVVLIGILLKDYYWWIDSVLGFIISLMLFYAVYEIMKEAITRILGEKPSDELIRRIQEIIHGSGYGQLHPHHFHIHNYGRHKELTFHIKVDKSLNIEEGHAIATIIEKTIFRDLDIVTTIHIEPAGVVHS